MNLLVENLSAARGGRMVIAGLSFKVSAGEALLLTGPNGAGKTTLIRTIAGFLTPAAGRIVLDGGDPDTEVAGQCHYIGHLNGIKASLTVAENLAFWAEFLGSGKRDGDNARVAAALHRFELESLANIPAGYLSAGQKRRAGLARLVVAERPLWLLDEPTVSLDAASTAIVAAVVTEHVAKGGLVIAATHLPLGLSKTRELKLGQNREAA